MTMSTSDYKLSTTALRPAEIPSEDAILSAGKAILEATATWKPAKAYHNKTVQTYSATKTTEDGHPWHCRVSEHSQDDFAFDELWDHLGKDKAKNEAQYVQEIKKATLIKELSPTQAIWSMYYTFPPPVSPRVFTILQTAHLEGRTGIIVSIPIDVTGPGDEDLAKLEEKGVHGRYTSAERLSVLENGMIEWCMATSSTAGGNIPTFVAERSIDSSIAKDVPLFLAWLRKIKPKPTPTSGPTTTATASPPQTT